jgi:hypothetical protein
VILLSESPYETRTSAAHEASVAPDIVEAILERKQSKAMQLKGLTDAIPSEWEKQRKALS